ncbi:MAG: hypothetical protein ThorAB25_26710 [Candidatus Thorarchaeota archaeon AB_25]|nr:MAG: hypothetical protein ThorAB25_26710 [Candidatus Thorarchaeota archaeon AB_25]
MKDDECIEKVTITVFPPMSGIGIVEADPVVEDEDACGDSSTSGVSMDVSKTDTVVIKLASDDPMEKISLLLEQAQVKFGESICIRWAGYDNKEKVDDAKEWLNAALRGSGDTTVLDDQGFSAFIGASAPIVSINNRLSFVGMIPNESQFISRIAATIRIVEEGSRD